MATPKPLSLAGADPREDHNSASRFAMAAAARNGVFHGAWVAIAIAGVGHLTGTGPEQASAIAEVAVPVAFAFGAIRSTLGHARDAIYARIHDGEQGERVRRRIEAKAGEVVATQSGALWLVSGPGTHRGTEPMTDSEYRAFKRGMPGVPFAEVTFTMDAMKVRRTVDGKLDSGNRDVAAFEVWDLEFNRCRTREWFMDGRKATKEAVEDRNAERRAGSEGPSSPGMR